MRTHRHAPLFLRALCVRMRAVPSQNMPLSPLHPKTEETMKLEFGEEICSPSKERIIDVVGKGQLAYVWIGGDDCGGCFGTLSARMALSLALAIQNAVKAKSRRRRARRG